MRTAIIGCGEVGEALGKVLAQYEPEFVDIEKDLTASGEFDIMHICINYSPDFVKIVKEYKKLFKPKYTVIHSTVAVGTSARLGAIFSPIRGMHPFLEEGIRTFPKFLAGEKASEVAYYFKRAGLKVILFDKAEVAEAGKLFDTEYYKTCIEFCLMVKEYCDDHSLNFHEVYTLFNQTYNEGYSKLGYPEYVRPVLQPIVGKIGGNCITQNSEILKNA